MEKWHFWNTALEQRESASVLQNVSVQLNVNETQKPQINSSKVQAVAHLKSHTWAKTYSFSYSDTARKSQCCTVRTMRASLRVALQRNNSSKIFTM